MSTSDLYILNQKSTTHYAEFKNGWGSGPACWAYLSEKYLGQEFNLFNAKPVWDLQNSDRLEDFEKIALFMTFDNGYIPLDKLEEAGEACIKFGEASDNGERVNHWTAFGETLKKASTEKFSRHARGIALACTSVSDMWIDAGDETLGKTWSIFGE